MQYMLMNYVREDGWTKLTKVEQAGTRGLCGVLGGFA